MDVCVGVFVAPFKDLMLAEAAQMINDNETEALLDVWLDVWIQTSGQ